MTGLHNPKEEVRKAVITEINISAETIECRP